MKVLFAYNHKFTETNVTKVSDKYKLDEERLNWLTELTNRSKGQTQFLFNLLEGDFEKLKQLEMKLKNCLCNYCPSDLEEVEKVMCLKNDMVLRSRLAVWSKLK